MRSSLPTGLSLTLGAGLLVLLAFGTPNTLAARTMNSAASEGSTDLIQKVRSFRQANESKILRDLATLVSLPNFAENEADIRRNAEYLVQQLEARGMSVVLLESPGSPPAVLGNLPASQDPETAKTVVFYAHYDGQPVDSSRWWSEPYNAQLRDGTGPDAKTIDLETLAAVDGKIDPEWRLFGRSASDDKSPIVAMLQAVDALAQADVPRSINLKFFFEGEEERGSPHLGEMLSTHQDLLDADLWLFCDGPVHQSRRQQVVFGVRGVMGVGITLYGPNRPLHSGHYGNWAPNPAARLAELVASMRDGEGKILIKGFYDKVREMGSAELAAIREAPPIDAALREDLDIAQSENNNAPLLQRILLPALNVKGLSAGMVGENAQNAVPSVAQAAIGFRLVPDLLPKDVRRLVEAHLVELGYEIVYQEPTAEQRRTYAKLIYLEWDNGYRSTQAPLNGAISEALLTVVDGIVAAQASIDGSDQSDDALQRALRLPLLGGSLPLYLFEEILQTPLVVLPMVNHDNNQHAPNENLRIQNLWDGIELYAGVIAELGKVWQH